MPIAPTYLQLRSLGRDPSPKPCIWTVPVGNPGGSAKCGGWGGTPLHPAPQTCSLSSLTSSHWLQMGPPGWSTMTSHLRVIFPDPHLAITADKELYQDRGIEWPGYHSLSINVCANRPESKPSGSPREVLPTAHGKENWLFFLQWIWTRHPHKATCPASLVWLPLRRSAPS